MKPKKIITAACDIQKDRVEIEILESVSTCRERVRKLFSTKQYKKYKKAIKAIARTI